MRRLLLLIACLVPLVGWAERFAIPPSFWLTPRSGSAVLEQPAVAQAVRLWLDRPRGRLLLYHARDDEALAQAEELRGWLIALGVDGARIELAPDGGVDRTMWIEVTPE